MHSFRDRVSVFCSILRWFGLFITFDRDFLVVEIFFLRCKRVVSIYNCCFCCIILLLISGVKKYLQNECHLAAKFGTKLAVFAVGVLFAICESYRGVVLIFMFLLVDAVFII